MSIDESMIRESHERDRRAVYVGTAVTAVATLVFFVLPDYFPVEGFRRWYFGLTGTVLRGNPLVPLRLCSGLVGGAVAGWLTSDLGSGAVTELKAALFGLVAAYLFAVAYFLVYSLSIGVFPPTMMVILMVPLIYGVPLFGAHPVGGALGGVLADRVLQGFRVGPAGGDENRPVQGRIGWRGHSLTE